MRHVFIAGAWNPETKTAGYAIMIAEHGYPDGYAAMGAVKCEDGSDTTNIELCAVEIASALLDLSGKGENMLHVSDRMVRGGLKVMQENGKHDTVTLGGIVHTDFADNGRYFALAEKTSDGDFIFGECAVRVRRKAAEMAGIKKEDAV